MSWGIVGQIPGSLLHPGNGHHPDGGREMSLCPQGSLEPWSCAEGQGCPPATPPPPFTPVSAPTHPHSAASLPQLKQTPARLCRDKGCAGRAQGAKSPSIKLKAAAPRELPPTPAARVMKTWSWGEGAPAPHPKADPPPQGLMLLLAAPEHRGCSPVGSVLGKMKGPSLHQAMGTSTRCPGQPCQHRVQSRRTTWCQPSTNTRGFGPRSPTLSPQCSLTSLPLPREAI